MIDYREDCRSGERPAGSRRKKNFYWRGDFKVTTATMRKIPMLDLKAQYRNLAGEIDAAVKKVLESQQLILGPEVKELEKEIAAYCHCEYAVGCASGSDALLLPLMAL